MSVIDFHTHILPAIDDGSKSVEDSVLMLKNEAEQGVQKVVMTPHFYANHDLPEHFLSLRSKRESELYAALEKETDLPYVVLGTEVHFFEGISDCEFLHDMSIADTSCVMIEMPMKPWSERNLTELIGISQKQKLTPVLAHVDRYIKPFFTKKLFDKLISLPVYIQVNASFFINRSTRKTALSLLREGKIHLIGSDCHNLDTRPPNISKALDIIKASLGDSAINYLERVQNSIFKN